MIEVGAEAPDFTLVNQDGNEVTLSELRGKTVVLAFYPSAFSPVCTDQMNLYQEVLPELEARDVVLFGVSVDNAFSQKAFREHLGVRIPLLADFHPKGAVSRSYGVYIEERGHTGRELVMVDPDGVVKWTYRPPSPLEVPGANLIFDALEASATAR